MELRVAHDTAFSYFITAYLELRLNQNRPSRRSMIAAAAGLEESGSRI